MEFKTVIRGTEIYLDTGSSALDFYAHHYEKVEPEVFDFIDTLTSEDLFLDLGACEGRYVAYAGKKGIKTIAVEPEAKNYAALERNVKHNSLTNVQLLNLATGRHAHVGQLSVGQDVSGGHQKVVLDAAGRSTSKIAGLPIQTINIVPLDSLNLKPTAIKLDVDGSELETLEGGEQTIRGCKQLIIELLSTDPNFARCRDLLTAWGFTTKAIYPIVYPWVETYLANYWMLRS